MDINNLPKAFEGLNVASNGNKIKMPRWLIQTIAGFLLTVSATGVVAINVRFGRLETMNAVQQEQIDRHSKRLDIIEEKIEILEVDMDNYFLMRREASEIYARKDWVIKNFIRND